MRPPITLATSTTLLTLLALFTLPNAACQTTEAQTPERHAQAEPIRSPDAPSVWSTYYYRAAEEDYGGAPTVSLRDEQCRPIAQVSEAFAHAACIEGSARLRDGRVINYARRCECARPCANGAQVCYGVLSRERFPWGAGNRNNALEPLVSWATDRAVIPSGSTIYVPEWDGLPIPAVDGLGGFTHDGCFRADDVGGAIDGDHVDIFVGTAGMWRALEAIRRTRSRQHAHVGSPRCAHLRQ